MLIVFGGLPGTGKTTIARWIAAQRGVLPRPPARVLELGCGNCASSSRWALMGYELVGVDISATAVAWARAAFADAGLFGLFVCGDVRRMTCLGDASFDLVVDGACLHCRLGPDRTSCLAEVMRVLRPAGTLIVSSMCGPPRSPEALSSYDRDHEVLMENGEALQDHEVATELVPGADPRRVRSREPHRQR